MRHPSARRIPYERVIQSLVSDLSHTKDLTGIWLQASDRPNGDENHIFLMDAFFRVGESLHGSSWTGGEATAHRRLMAFPSFSDTMLAFEKANPNLLSLASEDHAQEARSNPAPNSSINASSVRERLALDQATAEAHIRSLEIIGRRYMPAYETALNEWKAFIVANKAAVARRSEVIDWVVAAARNGRLVTLLRRVDTRYAAGEYQDAPAGFWNVEDALRFRFRTATVDHQLSADPTERFYIFFETKGFRQLLANLAHARSPADTGDGLHLSIYMQLMQRAIREMKITPENQPKKIELDAFFKSAWRALDPDGDPLSQNMADAMASLVRDPESQKGRARK